jgi:hypothetical protein
MPDEDTSARLDGLEHYGADLERRVQHLERRCDELERRVI